MLLLLSVFIEFIIFFWFAGKIFELRKSNLRYVISLCLFQVLIFLFLFFMSYQRLNPLVLFCLGSLTLMLFYEGTIFNKIIYIVYFILITILSEFIIANIIELFVSGFSINIYNTTPFAFGAILVNVLQLFFLILFKKYCQLYKKGISIKWFLITLILPVTTCVFILNIPNYLIVTNKNGSILFVLVIGLFVANLMTFYMFAKMLETINLKNELTNLKNKEKLEKMNYAFLEKRYHQNFTILHRIKEKTFEMINEADRGNDKKVINLGYEVVNDLTKMMVLSTIGPKSLNLIMDDELSVITANNINFKSIFDYDDFSFMTIKDQFELFSILIKSAVEIVLNQKKENRIIILKCYLIRGCIQLYLGYSGDELLNTTNIENIIVQYDGKVVLNKEDNFCEIIVSFNKGLGR